MAEEERRRLLGIIYRRSETADLMQPAIKDVQAEYGGDAKAFEAVLQQLHTLGCLDDSACQFDHVKLSGYGRRLAQAGLSP